jgi:acyl-coenzyme A thioesterase PaaI-like protein
MNIDSLTIRMAASEDTPALRRLAELDSARPLSGGVMLAQLDGACLAAISLESGEVTANPFERTAAIVSHLRMRRYQVMRQGGDVAPARSLLRRLAPIPTR